jgi:hypothetical protein
MRRLIPFAILMLLMTIGCVLNEKSKGAGRNKDISHLARSPQTCPVQVTAQLPNASEPNPYISASNGIYIDKSFSPSRVRHLQKALRVLHQVANEDKRCNRSFGSTGDLRVLRNFLEDSRIRIHYDPVQEYSNEGPTIAYTEEGSKYDIYVQPYAWRLSSGALARALVHEFTHITLTPHPGQEEEAQLMEVKCGFRKRVLPPPIRVTASPAPVPLLQSD